MDHHAFVFKKNYTPDEIIKTYLPGKCIRLNGGIDDFWPILQDDDILTYDWDIQTWNSGT